MTQCSGWHLGLLTCTLFPAVFLDSVFDLLRTRVDLLSYMLEIGQYLWFSATSHYRHWKNIDLTKMKAYVDLNQFWWSESCHGTWQETEYNWLLAEHTGWRQHHSKAWKETVNSWSDLLLWHNERERTTFCRYIYESRWSRKSMLLMFSDLSEYCSTCEHVCYHAMHKPAFQDHNK